VRVAAAELAADQVAAVRDRPRGRLDLLAACYDPVPGFPPLHLRYGRAASAFMGWQLGRGVLNALDTDQPGSPWWRAVNERLLRDTCEARARLLGHPGPASSPTVEASYDFARDPDVLRWYQAHNVTIATAYLDHRDLAERENEVERFFINLVLMRVLFAHAMVAAPRLALGWLAPVSKVLGDPRRAMTGIFLSISRVLPDVYPLEGALAGYVDDEHTIGRLLDVGVIAPRIDALYEWSAEQLQIPELADLVSRGVPAYAWDPSDHDPWSPAPNLLASVARRAVPTARRTSLETR
jgi:hypothetical protein